MNVNQCIRPIVSIDIYQGSPSVSVYLANIFQGRIEYELTYGIRGAKHRVDYSVHIC